MKHFLQWLTTHLLHLLHIAPSPAVCVFVGRARTHDAAKPKKPTLEQHIKEWLKESLLDAKDLPGEVVPQENARTIEFFTIDGKRISGAAIQRRFKPTSGIGALVEGEPKPKYKHPDSQPLRLYFPVVGGFNWAAIAKDKNHPLIFVEGCKKAACLCKVGIPAIGVEGCWGFRTRNSNRLMLEEFDYFDFSDDRIVYWIPDHDPKPKTIADVWRASNDFARRLLWLGAIPHVVWLPLVNGDDRKVAADDFVVHYSRNGRDIPAARRAFQDQLADAKPWRDFEVSDTGNAARWVQTYGHGFRYVGGKIRGRWLVYRDGRWQDDARLEVQTTTKEMFAEMLQGAENIGNSDLKALLRRHITADRIDNVPRVAKDDVIVTPSELDRHPLLVNCKNGTLEMPQSKNEGLRFREHRPENLLTKSVSVNWNEKVVCPVFKEALTFWTNEDRDLQRTIQQLLGISCTGDTSIQSFILLYGPGASGKSTLIEIVREILADYAITLPSETLLLRRYGKEEERKLATLPGARFATASETESGGVMDENLMKLLTGEDTVAGRRLYEESFNFKPEIKIWLRTNNKPEIRGTGNDVWRRIITLPFGQEVPEGKKDPHLKNKLRQELEGIFAWMVHGYVDYVQNGLFLAPIVMEAKEQYRKEQNILERFFDDRCEFGPDHNIGKEHLYMAFEEWCKDSAVRVIPPITKFKTEIESRFNDRICEKRITVMAGSDKRQERRWVGVNTKRNLSQKY